MQFIGSNQIFCLLCDFSVFGRKQFRTDRCIQYIQKNIRQFLIAAGIRKIPHKMAYQCLRYGSINSVHGHVVSIIGGPAKCQLRKVTGTDYHSSGLIGNIHNHLGTLSGLTVFIRHIVLISIMSDITEMNRHGLFDVHFSQSCSQLSSEITGIPIGTVCGSKTGHSDCRDAFPAQSQIIKRPGGHKKCQCGIQTSGNTKNCTAAMSVFQTFFQSHCLDRKNFITSFFPFLFIGGYKRFCRKYPLQTGIFYFQ